MWKKLTNEDTLNSAIDNRLSVAEKSNLNSGKMPNGNKYDLGMINDTAEYVKVTPSQKTLLTSATSSRGGAAGTIPLRSDEGQMQLENLDVYTLDVDNPSGYSVLNLFRNTGYFADIHFYDDAESTGARFRLDTDDNFNIIAVNELSIGSVDDMNFTRNSRLLLSLKGPLDTFPGVNVYDALRVHPKDSWEKPLCVHEYGGDSAFQVQVDGSTNRIILSEDNSPKVKISSSGDSYLNGALGILTDSPSHALDVNGNARLVGSLYVSNIYRSSGTMSIDADTGIVFKGHGTSYMGLNVNDAEVNFWKPINTGQNITTTSNMNAGLYQTGSYSGQTELITVLTDIWYTNMGVLQVKQRSVQVRNGIVTNVGAESDWITPRTQKV